MLKRQLCLQATFRTQAHALFRRNAAQQRRSVYTNIFIVSTPIFFCLLLFILQQLINAAIDTPDSKCGCLCLTCCTTVNGVKTCRNGTTDNPCVVYDSCEKYDDNKCGFQYSSAKQAAFCAVESPSIWPAVAQVPSEGYLAHPYSPNAAMLVTGDENVTNTIDLYPPPNITPAETSAALEFAVKGNQTGAYYVGAISLLGVTLGTFQKYPNLNLYIEPAFYPTTDYNGSLYLLSSNTSTGGMSQALSIVNTALNQDFATNGGDTLTAVPLQTEQVFVGSAAEINNILYCGYKQARCNSTSEINGYTNAFDFTGTDFQTGNYSMRLWYNATDRYPANGNAPTEIVRVQAALNAASNAFLRNTIGEQAITRLVGLMQMPKPATSLTLDIASLIGTLFYTWLLQLLLPVMLSTLVMEKEGRLRNMMKMHGLGDEAYWIIQYIWYFMINLIYVWILIGIGTAINLAFFKLTSYSFQFVFYLLWVSCLIATTFLLSSLFASTRTAVVTSFLYVFGTGLVGYLLLAQFVAAGYWWVIFFELIPGFGLYRGLYEIGQFAFRAAYGGNPGITWSNLNSDGNGIVGVMIIFAVESVVFMLAAWYIEKVFPKGCGVPEHPLFFLGKKYKSGLESGKDELNSEAAGKDVPVPVEPEDVAQERARVQGIASDYENMKDTQKASILIQNLQKVFPGKVKKVAVRDLTMAVSRGECFGLLGPNGAGKSTSLNILTGFLTPSAGTAVVEGFDIKSDMHEIYRLMGVCPQDNLLWEGLSAREHLLFYARLKNLHDDTLQNEVNRALKSVNLLNGGVADKPVKTFSGGMKRRLSVAISLIGGPAVVYLDEPSTGLDPASRQNLWRVVKAAKPGRGIILTTHSMEEAAVLCDRLGIFVDGQLVCIGAPKELTARYGDYYIFTITTDFEQSNADDITNFVRSMCPTARQTYALAGTHKYELPTTDVTLDTVFDYMHSQSARDLNILDWGISNATLEEVFIKFAKELGLEGGN